MAVGVFKPQRPGEQGTPSALGGLLGTAGSIIGSIYGGPAGGAAGGMAGNMIGGAIAPGKQAVEGSRDTSVGTSENALQRRQASLDDSPLRQIHDSIDSLKYLPPEQQAGLADPLMKAEQMARKKGYT